MADQAVAITHHGVPPGRDNSGYIRPIGSDRHGPHWHRCGREQIGESGVETGELAVITHLPGPGQGSGQVDLLGDQIFGPVT